MILVPAVLLLAGFPLFVLLLATAAILLVWFMSVPLAAVPQLMFSSVDKFSLLAVPFFLFVGEIMSVGGMSRRIVDWVLALIGGVRGSRGLTTVGACTVFGAISGSSVATVAAVGRLMYPSLKVRYGERFGAGVIASTGAIDILIPPSIVMILYGASAEQSVAVLFIAGILPAEALAAEQQGLGVAFGLAVFREPTFTTWRGHISPLSECQSVSGYVSEQVEQWGSIRSIELGHMEHHTSAVALRTQKTGEAMCAS